MEAIESLNVAGIGTVVDINPAAFSADVAMTGGQVLQGVAILGVYGSAYGQDITWLTSLRGAVVRLARIGSEYFILHTMPTQQIEKQEGLAIPVTEAGYGGSNEATYAKGVYTDYTANRDTAFFPGDRVLRAGTDAEVSLWREGVARLKASALAQFILYKYKDLAQLISRAYSFISDFGEVNSTHSPEGRVGLHIKGGADFLGETHPNAKKWTLQVWLGDQPDDPDSRLYVRVNDADDQEYVTLKYDIKGNQVFHATGDDTQVVDGSREHRILGEESVTVVKDATRTVLGSQDENVSGDNAETVGGSHSSTVTGGWSIKVVGVASIKSDSAISLQAPMISLN